MLGAMLAALALLTSCAETTGELPTPVENEETICAEAESNSSLPEIQSNGEYDIQELYAVRDGLSIYGVAYIPNTGQDKNPAVIMSHGFNNNYASQEVYAKALAEVGIASYIFDFCGGSTGSRSDGSMLDMSLRTEAKDLNAVIDLMQMQSFVDSENIFLMGRSMGGAASALAAAQRPDDIKGVILIYPAFVIPDSAKQYATAEDIPEQTTLMGAAIGSRFYEDILDMDIYSEIQGYQNNVLIIHGDRDSLVPISYSKRAVSVYNAAELIVLEGAGHGFYGQDADNSIVEMIDYIMHFKTHTQIRR